MARSESSDSIDDWAAIFTADIGDAEMIAVAERQEGQADGAWMHLAT